MINSFGALPGLYSGINKNNLYASFSSIQNEQKQKFKQEQYNDIFEHEKAHKRAAGSLGGNIVIEKNSEGIPVAGHVDIKMPVLDKSNPDKTIEHADTVIKSAMAPEDPSSQDYKVANEAKQIKAQAVSEKHKQTHNSNNNKMNETGKKLNFVA